MKWNGRGCGVEGNHDGSPFEYLTFRITASAAADAQDHTIGDGTNFRAAIRFSALVIDQEVCQWWLRNLRGRVSLV